MTFSKEEIEVIYDSVNAIARGPFIDDDEFSTVIGSDRTEIADLASGIKESDLLIHLNISTIICAMGNLLNYPHRLEKNLSQYVQSPALIEPTLNKLKELRRQGRSI